MIAMDSAGLLTVAGETALAGMRRRLDFEPPGTRTVGAHPTRECLPGTQAFSLIEVVLAIGVFAAAIVAVIGLLGPSLRTTREVLDTTVAARLAEGVEGELKRVTFAVVATETSPGQTLVVYATSEGSRLVEHSVRNNTATSTPPGILQGERYYVIFISRLSAPTATPAVLPLQIRVEWPYLQESTTEPLPDPLRSSFSFNAALLR